jgi:SSS family solute:Na+ symporter/sodium/pantothenate symporter
MAYFSGGLDGFLSRLAAIDPLLAAPVNPESPLFRSAFEVFVANFAIGVAVVTQPHIISKALYLRTERDVNAYLATGFVVLIVFFCVLVVGLYARLLLPAGDLAPDRVVPTYLVEVFSPGVRGLVAIGLVAAGFSTLEGLLLALSAIFANDIYGTWARRYTNLTEEVRSARAVRYGKVFMVALVPILALLSWQQIQAPNLSVAILAQNGVYALFSATFAPILFGIFADRMPAWGAAAAALSALGVHFGMYYGQIGPYWNNPAVPATFALATSVAVAAGALLLTRRTSESVPAAP